MNLNRRYQDFHEDIEVKENDIVLLEEALARKRKKGIISTGSMSDPYMLLEIDLCYSRKALTVIENTVSVLL
ncbi:MAG: hypothetical protein LKE64_10910 [Solobacterium sp.]|nr:hypothetical protein [Solobacterium sp.]MCH4048266.1 hypothetical protein [Solobacterium sp.]MCH4074880.1 hypothetical protein [Solobacterium sp.]MCI1314267.1 hypothetical protein [Solobacterium sp.]MCI1346342.1 hypothetical protein [Solobacterium sp.]